MRHPSVLIAAGLCLVSVADVSAQDVEMFGQRYGTRPPQSYYDEVGRNGRAFQFLRGRSARTPELEAGVFNLRGPRLALGPRTGAVTGIFRVPVLPALYSDPGASAPVTRDTILTGYFGPQAGTIKDYYDEVSGGLVTLEGDVQDWVQLGLSSSTVTGGSSGLFAAPLGGGGAGNFVYEAVALHAGVDWAPYDNDGPDGFPNSGDDDGFVDAVAVVHTDMGAECSASGRPNRLWSHYWSLTEAVGTTFETSTPAFGGGFLKIDDYIVVPALSCNGSWLNEIGVFTHELGHSFGLPDLYDTDGGHDGSGTWDLMGTGAWGCNWQITAPESPCHLGAWSKEMLGWGTVVTLAPDTDHGTVTLPPVEASGTIYRVDANDGSGEYFLLENRQRVGYDQHLSHEGLLVWQIDPDWIMGSVLCDLIMETRWQCNTVNAEAHMGVWLRQADGLDELGLSSAENGDRGDPFPGWTGNDAFHAATNPAATSYQGGATGVTLFNITESGDDIDLRLLTRFTTLTVRANGTLGNGGLFSVDGIPVDPPLTTFPSAPFVEHTIEAVVGEDLGPGVRRPFLEWSDAPPEPRVRIVTTPVADYDYVAEYGSDQHQLDLTLTGGVSGIAPATIVSTPPSVDLWYPVGTNVTLGLVDVTGFNFLGWTGALAGQPNPASVDLTTPVAAGADFELVYVVSTSQVDLTAAVVQDIQLETENGTGPYSWRIVSGVMPLGLDLSGTGRITGNSVDVGSFPVTLEATDAIGLPATGVVTLEVAAPAIAIEQLASSFLLSGPALDAAQEGLLDRQGNQNAAYDLGDFRAWILSNPTLPLSAFFETRSDRRTIVVPIRFEQPGTGR